MSFVYVTEHDALIRLSGGKIIIEKAKKNLAEVPKNTIDGLVLLSSVQIPSQAIVEFLRIGIPVTWISGTQKFYGRLESMEIILKFIPKTILISRIIGYEGVAAKNYFSALGEMVSKEFSFGKHSRRPPRDMFNSMLSFGYSLLMSEVHSAINNSGLHPYFGFMHAMKEHHPTLASDLMEEWRPILIDSLVMALVSHNEIKPNCFEPADADGVYLNSAGKKFFINA